jgi:predicted HAD superfamily phosphohydrolase YqeG
MPDNHDNPSLRSSEAIVKDLHNTLVQYTEGATQKRKHQLLIKARDLSEELQHVMYSRNDKMNNLFAIKLCALEVFENDLLSSPEKGS